MNLLASDWQSLGHAFFIFREGTIKQISWQQALGEGLRIIKPRRIKENRFRDVPGETTREKAYWVFFTLKATNKEIAEVMKVSTGTVNNMRKKMSF